MTRNWELRPALPGDREFLWELNRATMREYVQPIWGWREDEQALLFERRLRPPGSSEWIITAEGRDVGALSLWERADDVFLALIAVSPDRQGRGIGTAVLRSVRDDAFARGKPVVLQVLRSNPRARLLYEREGFVLVSESVNHVHLRAEPPGG